MTDSPGYMTPTPDATGRSSDLIGELVLLRPVEGEKTIDTDLGKALVVFVEALIVLDDGDYRNLGITPIFWDVVRRELNQAYAQGGRWIAGRVKQIEGRRYYQLAAPEPDDAPKLEKVLSRHLSDPIPVEEPDDADDAPF